MTTEKEIGMELNTPRWGSVTIDAVFDTREDAWAAGFSEPTGRRDVYGKHVGTECNGNTVWSKYEWAFIREFSEASA